VRIVRIDKRYRRTDIYGDVQSNYSLKPQAPSKESALDLGMPRVFEINSFVELLVGKSCLSISDLRKTVHELI
jgi:hypothetical protein